MKALKRVDCYRLTIFATIFAVFLIINLSLKDKFDDYAFKTSLENLGGNLFSWCIYFWNTWSSRIIPQGIGVWLMSLGGMAFGICNAAMQATLIMLIGEYSGTSQVNNHNANFKKYICIVVAFFAYLGLIPLAIHAESDLWQIASVLYLWGTVCALFCMKSMWDRLNLGQCIHSKAYAIFAVIAAIYAGSCEQSAPLVIAFGIIAELYLKLVKKLPFSRLNLTIIGTAASTFLLCLCAKGNALRTDAEVLGSVSFYYSMSFVDKVFWGIIAAVKIIVESYSPLLFALCIIIAIIVFKNKQSVFNKISSIIPCIYFGLSWLLQWMKDAFLGQALPFEIDTKIYNIAITFPPRVSFSVEQWASTILAVFICVWVAAMLFGLVEHQIGFAPALLYCAGFALIAVIGFTPSGRFYTLRTAFVPGVLIILAACRLGFVGANAQNLSEVRENAYT